MEPRHPHILMLGWEYPPRVAGGLGKASQGLARGLAALGATVDFVLPRAPWREDAPALAVGGVRAWLARGDAPRAPVPVVRSGLNVFAIPSGLHPYARPLDDDRAGTPATWPETEPDFADPLYGHDLGHEVARFADEVVALAPRLDAELVHANDWMSFPAAFAAARARHLPVFLHVHSTEYDRSGEAVNPFIADIERQAFAHAAHVFAVSRYTAHVLATRYGVPAERISVVYNAPDAGERRFRALLPAADRAPWVVFLGRLTFQKGPDHFLRAVAQVARLRPDARFLVCGGGDMADGLAQLAGSLGIAERVVFTGFLGPAAVERVLAQARVLVMPSVSEPFGLVALEALGLGTPVIVSRQSGVREVLGHALEVDFWDHDKLADQILAVLRLPALNTQLVETGGTALSRLSWEASAARILDVCRRVAGTPGAGP